MDRPGVRHQRIFREAKQTRSTALSSSLDSSHSTECKPPAKPTAPEQVRARSDKIPESGYSTPSEGLTFSTTRLTAARIRPSMPTDVRSPQNFCLSSRDGNLLIQAPQKPALNPKDVRPFKYETAPRATARQGSRTELPKEEDTDQITEDDFRELPAGTADMFDAISKLVTQFLDPGYQGTTTKENIGTSGEVSPPKTKNESRASRQPVQAVAVPPVASSTRPVLRSTAVTKQKNDSLAVDSIADIDLRVVSREGEPDSKDYIVAWVLLAVFVVFLFVVFYFFASTHGRNTAGSHTSVPCVSNYCVKEAEYLGQLLSWKDDPPCDNFYMFVCRGWKSQYMEAPPLSFVSQDDDNIASLEQSVYAMLQNKAENSKSLSWLRDLMDKCMDEKQIEGDGWDSLLEVMSDASVGPFPLTPPVRRSLSVWKSAGRLLRKTGTTALFSITVVAAPSGSPNNILAIGPPETPRHGAMSTDNVVKQYTNAIFSAVKALKKRFVPVENLLEIARFAASYENVISHSAVSVAIPMSTTNYSSHIAKFLSSVFYDRWPEYTEKLASDVLVLSPNIVRRIIQLMESTELHTTINYLALRLMIQVSPFIPHADLTQVFSTFLTGRPTITSPRWKICLRAVEKALAPLMYASYFTYQNLHAPASQFADFVGEAAQQFLRGVDDSSYFTASSKTAFRDVLSQTHFRVLGPPWVSDSAAMEAYIQTLPTIRPAHTALQSYTGVYEATFLYSLSRGSSQQWTRSMFATECWHELNPRTLYVPLLTFNVTLWSYTNIQPLQVSMAGFRVQQCILEMLLGHTAFANDQPQWWLDEATKHKLESGEACLDRIAGRGNVREPLAIVKRSLSVRLACEHFQRSVNASGRKLTLHLPNGEVLTETQLFFVLLVLQSCESSPAEGAAPSLEFEWNAALGNDPELSAAFACPPRFRDEPGKEVWRITDH
ncbi:hypothetical protein MTO96_014559 [Rhipicephalus appendiculatus]